MIHDDRMTAWERRMAQDPERVKATDPKTAAILAEIGKKAKRRLINLSHPLTPRSLAGGFFCSGGRIAPVIAAPAPTAPTPARMLALLGSGVKGGVCAADVGGVENDA